MQEKRRLVDALRSGFVETGEGEYTHPDFVGSDDSQAPRNRDERVAQANALGFSFVCAMCENLWLGLDRGHESCGVSDCKGPRGGGEFKDYRGPLPREYWRNFCVVCGKPSVGAFRVKVGGSARATVFGVCEEHKSLFGGTNERRDETGPGPG